MTEKIFLYLALFIWLFNVSFAQDVQVRVDFNKAEYYPLVKTKASIFLEDLPMYESIRKRTIYDGDSLYMQDLMTPLNELKIGYFRTLVNQADGRQVYLDNGQVKIVRMPETIKFIEESHEKNIIPVLTLFKTPQPLRSTVDGKLRGPNAPPANFKQYGSSMGKFSRLFDTDIPLVWEVWNEPELRGFLDSDQPSRDYNAIYLNLAPEIKKANPDFLVAGPAAAGIEGKVENFCNSFTSMVKKNDLPLDLYTIHAYGRFAVSYVEESRKSSDHTDYIVNVARNSMGENFQTTPIVFTEYEFYPAGKKHTEIHENRHFTIGAVRFLADLKYFISQTDIQAVTWNRYVNRGETYMKGGLIDHYLNRRPIFYAFKYYGQMPVERKELSLDVVNGVDGFASANQRSATIMLWNASEAKKTVNLSITNLPEDVVESGYMAVYHIDSNNASYLENGIEESFPAVVERITSDTKSVQLEIPSPGIAYVKFEQDVLKEGVREVAPSAKFIRNWQWCGRTEVNGKTQVTGDYGNFDWQTWTANVGVKGTAGRGIAGVTMEQVPSKMDCSFKTTNTSANNLGQNSLIGLRIDYFNGQKYNKSVLFHGALYDPNRTESLPWAQGGPTGDIVKYSEHIGSGEKFTIDFESFAPDDWKSSDQRRVTLSFWLENSGRESQAIVKLFASDVNNKTKN